MARPELLERRPSWSGAPLRLEPLQPGEADALIGDSVPKEARRRIAESTGGNPLFITEMVALASDGEELDVPPTLKALLTARLDQLDPQERSVLERGAVEGEIFHRGAVQALRPDEPEVLPRLAALVRQELIRADGAQFPGEDAFRFRHLLIRDAAYEALPKGLRADLHRRLADWLEERHALVELDELAGYHLEQAARYEAELGRPDPALALRAGDRILAAARRAADRDDDRAAIALYERALELTRPFRSDVHAEIELAGRFQHEPVRAGAICDDAAVRAAAAGDETGAALARAMALFFRGFSGADTTEELETVLLDLRPRLEEIDDHAGLAQVWYALGFGVANGKGRIDEWTNAAEQSYRHSRLAGRAARPAGDLGITLIYGSRPADEALERLDRHLAESSRTSWLLLTRAWLLAMLERGAEVQESVRAAKAMLRGPETVGFDEWLYAEISALGGDHAEASRRLGLLCDWLEETQQYGFLPTYFSRHGRSLCKIGRLEEAERCLDARERSWRSSTAQISGDTSSPARSWRASVRREASWRRPSDSRGKRWPEARTRLAQRPVPCPLGPRRGPWPLRDASTKRQLQLEQALERAQRKKNLALARQLRERLAELRAETQPAL